MAPAFTSSRILRRSWSARSRLPTSLLLDCLGECYLDGEKAQESFKATVDADGSFIWKLS